MIKERDALITRWLDPNAEETKVVHGVAPPLRQLAADLSAHFGIRPLSERAVWQYVQEARASSNGLSLVTRRRGRPPIEIRGDELVGPKRPCGRPRKVAESPATDSVGETHQGGINSPRRVSAASRNADLLAQLAAEAMQLTGLSPNALHRTFFGQTGWDDFLGRRSGFFYRLKKLDTLLLTADTSAIRPDDDIDHSLRLHQVTLQTLDGLWCILLLGYEPRSHFLNAACYVAHSDSSAVGPARLSGRPIKRLHPDWRCTLATDTEPTSLRLPAEAILAFSNETRTRMAVPVDTVWLSSSLGPQAELIAQLRALAPDGRFLGIARQHQVFVPADAGKGIRVTTLCQKIELLLDQHYQNLAFAKLDDYQARIDRLIEKAFHIRSLPSGRQVFRRRKLLSVLGGVAEANVDRKLAEALVEYRGSVAERPHKKFCLAVAPIHLACDVR